MARNSQAISKILTLAGTQHGVFARWQAMAAGVTGSQVLSRINNGQWKRVHPSVYRVAGAPEDWRSRLYAALLWAGPGAAASHRTAALLHGFSRFREGDLHLIFPREKRAPAKVHLHIVDKPRGKELEKLEGVPVTSVLRTLFDLAATENEADVQVCVDEALRNRWVTLESLEAALEFYAGRHGVPLMKRLVAEFQGAGGPTESELEARVLEVLDQAGFPRPVSQQPVHASGQLRRLDFRFANSPVVIEADGYAYHSGLAAFEKDRERLNALRVRGFIVLQWTWKAMNERADELTSQLRRVLPLR